MTHSQYDELEKAYFEDLVAKASLENSWNSNIFRVTGNRDLQGRVEDAHQQVGAEEGREGVKLEEAHDEYASSPIVDEDWDAATQTLKDMTGDPVVVIEGLKQIWERAKPGSKKQELRGAVKNLVRVCAALKDEESDMK